MGHSALFITAAEGDDGRMSARMLTLGTTELPDLASVRRELEHLLWSRDVWSPHDARSYAELTELELRLLSSAVARA
jgi:hypothetical protein